MPYDGVLNDVWRRKADPLLFAVGGPGLGEALLLQRPLSLIVEPQLLAPHPPHQPLTLAQRQRLQQTLVYLHVLPEHVT